MFILAGIVAVIAIAAILIGFTLSKRGQEVIRYGRTTNPGKTTGRWLKIGGAGGIVLTLVLTFFSSFYTQDVGEAKVLKDWTGNIVGQDVSAGADFKAPWVDTVDFDIRNQIAAYVGNGQDNYNGQLPNGPQITVQDREGVTANLDVVVVYSVKADAVTDIYREYLNQENFQARLIEQDIRSVVRNVPAKYGTLELLNGREQVGADIQEALVGRWAEKGVIVESVSLQEIRYSDEVKARFDAAQSARIEVEKAEAELDKAEVDAQQKVVQATAEADANNILAQSLTDPILQQRYLDTLRELAQAGNLVITDGSAADILVQR